VETCSTIMDLIAIIAPPQAAEALLEQPGILGEVDVILSGWGCWRSMRRFSHGRPIHEQTFMARGS